MIHSHHRTDRLLPHYQHRAISWTFSSSFFCPRHLRPSHPTSYRHLLHHKNLIHRFFFAFFGRYRLPRSPHRTILLPPLRHKNHHRHPPGVLRPLFDRGRPHRHFSPCKPGFAPLHHPFSISSNCSLSSCICPLVSFELYTA